MGIEAGRIGATNEEKTTKISERLKPEKKKIETRIYATKYNNACHVIHIIYCMV